MNILRRPETIRLMARLLKKLKRLKMGRVKSRILFQTEKPVDLPELEYLELEIPYYAFTYIHETVSADTGTPTIEYRCNTKFENMSFNPPKTLKTLKLTLNHGMDAQCLYSFVQRFNLAKLIIVGGVFDEDPSNLWALAKTLTTVHEIAVTMTEILAALEETATNWQPAHKIRIFTFMDVPKEERVKLMKKVGELNVKFKKEKNNKEIKVYRPLEFGEFPDDMSFKMDTTVN